MRKYIIPILVVIIIALSATSFYFYKLYADGKALLVRDYYEKMSLVGRTAIQDEIYRLENDKWWIKSDAVIQYIDRDAYYSGSGKRVYFKVENMDFKLESRALTAYTKAGTDKINVPVHTIDGIRYLDMAMLETLYPVRHTYYEETGVHLLAGNDAQLKQVILKQKATLSDKTTKRALEVGVADKNEMIILLAEEGDQSRVISSEGEVGYMPTNQIQSIQPIDIHNEPVRERISQVIPEQVRLAWHQVYDYKFYTGQMKYGPEEGLDILSPTFFSLNVDGIVLNIADQTYVETAHEKDLQVWALFSNSFDPDWTHEMLSDKMLRKKVIGQLAAYSALYNLDGINIDFENVYMKDKDQFAEFVAELSEILHQQNMIVSVDVTVPWGSERYSLFADREALSKSVDFVMLMAYDEHWASIQTPGSVASRDWVEKGIVESLELIPRDKLILGIPFYSRVWSQIGSGKVSSKALGFEGQSNWLERTGVEPVFDEATGQNYAEALIDGVRERIWFEDALSLKMRLDLAKKHDLPGIAGWSMLFTTEDVWSQIQSEYPRGGDLK